MAAAKEFVKNAAGVGTAKIADFVFEGITAQEHPFQYVLCSLGARGFTVKAASKRRLQASGLRAHTDSDGVGSVLGSPAKKPAGSAYELALAEGRALLQNPYTSADGAAEPATLDMVSGGPKPTKSRTGYTPPKYGVGDVVSHEGEGEERKLTIEFKTFGTKTILERFVKPVTD